MLSDGSYGTIDSIGIEALLEPEVTYNFEVADYHTYYVGECNVLVHNMCGKKGVDASKDETAVIGKMKDLNSYELKPNEYKVADLLPDLGSPKANWKQNSSVLKKIINKGKPIRDVSIYPMNNAGFLGAERNLLLNKGWTYNNGFWYPGGRKFQYDLQKCYGCSLG